MMGKLKSPLGILLSLIAIIEIGCFGYTFIFEYISMDPMEHLTAAWYVSNGYLPYIDFFEHHHPLLWYLIAPIVRLMYGNIFILYISRVLSLLMYCFWGCALWKISRDFLKISNKACLWAVILLFLVRDFISQIWEMRPDTLMWGFFYWGLYFCFRYLEQKKCSDLVIGLGAFAISFLFLQKIAFLLLLCGIYGIYLVYKGKIKLAHALIAGLVGLVIVGGFWLNIYQQGIFELYWKLNYEISNVIVLIHRRYSDAGYWGLVYLLQFGALISLKYFWKEKNIYRRIIFYLTLADYLLSYFWSGFSHQYFINSLAVSALIMANFIIELPVRKQIGIWVGYLMVSLYVISLLPFNRDFVKYYRMYAYVEENRPQDEAVINSTYNMLTPIYAPLKAYYWFGYSEVAPLADLILGFGEEFDFNAMLKHYKPKFIMAEDIGNTLYKSNMTNLGKQGYYVENLALYKAKLKRAAKLLKFDENKTQEFIERFSSYNLFELDQEFIKQNYRLNGLLYERIDENTKDQK